MMNFRNLHGKVNLFLILLFLLSVRALTLNESQNTGIIQGLKQIENKLLDHINSTRVKAGMAPVFSHEDLKEIAEKHNQEMIRTGQLSHHFPGYDGLGKRLSNAYIPFLRCGENLAMSDLLAAAFIHDQFMQSPEHRKNILNPLFTHCGIKVSPGRNSFFISQTYVQLPIPQSEAEAEFLLKEHLESWFVNQFNYRYLYHRSSEDTVRNLSKNRIARAPLSGSKRQWGRYHTLITASADFENIKSKLKSEIEKISLEALSLGISLKKSSQSPGRNYSVAAMLFGTFFNDMPPHQLEKILLNALNRVMVKKGHSIFRPDDRLNLKAAHLLASLSGNTLREEAASERGVFIFRLTNPLRVLPELETRLASSRNETGVIGISVRVISRNHSLSDQLLVCLVLPN